MGGTLYSTTGIASCGFFFVCFLFFRYMSHDAEKQPQCESDAPAAHEFNLTSAQRQQCQQSIKDLLRILNKRSVFENQQCKQEAHTE